MPEFHPSSPGSGPTGGNSLKKDIKLIKKKVAPKNYSRIGVAGSVKIVASVS